MAVDARILSNDEAIREKAAADRRAENYVYWALAEDESKKVLLALANNPEVPFEVKEAICHERDNDILNAVIQCYEGRIRFFERNFKEIEKNMYLFGYIEKLKRRVLSLQAQVFVVNTNKLLEQNKPRTNFFEENGEVPKSDSQE